MDDLAEAEPSEEIPGMASTSVAPWLAPRPRVVWGKGGARPVVPVVSDEVDPVVMGTEVDLELKSLLSAPVYESSFIYTVRVLTSDIGNNGNFSLVLGSGKGTSSSIHLSREKTLVFVRGQRRGSGGRQGGRSDWSSAMPI
jgi:hypothetical protein